MQTDYFSIDPRWDAGPRETAPSSERRFTVRRKVTITLRDLSQFEPTITSSIEAGANKIIGVQFQTTQLRKHRDTARLQAIKAAKEKAVDLAKALGKTIGDPLVVTEDSSRNYWYSWYDYGWWGSSSRSGGGNWSQSMGPESNIEQGTLRPGQIGVTARVTVTFALR